MSYTIIIYFYTTKECCAHYLFVQRNVVHNILQRNVVHSIYLDKGMFYIIFVQRNVVQTICTKECCTQYLYKGMLYTLFVQIGMLYTISIRTKEYCTQYLYTIFFNWKIHFLQQGLSFAVVYSILNISTQKPLIDTGLTGKFLFIVNDSFNVHLIYTWVIIFCIKYKTFLKNQIIELC